MGERRDSLPAIDAPDLSRFSHNVAHNATASPVGTSALDKGGTALGLLKYRSQGDQGEGKESER